MSTVSSSKFLTSVLCCAAGVASLNCGFSSGGSTGAAGSSASGSAGSTGSANTGGPGTANTGGPGTAGTGAGTAGTGAGTAGTGAGTAGTGAGTDRAPALGTARLRAAGTAGATGTGGGTGVGGGTFQELRGLHCGSFPNAPSAVVQKAGMPTQVHQVRRSQPVPRRELLKIALDYNGDAHPRSSRPAVMWYSGHGQRGVAHQPDGPPLPIGLPRRSAGQGRRHRASTRASSTTGRTFFGTSTVTATPTSSTSPSATFPRITIRTRVRPRLRTTHKAAGHAQQDRDGPGPHATAVWYKNPGPAGLAGDPMWASHLMCTATFASSSTGSSI